MIGVVLIERWRDRRLFELLGRHTLLRLGTLLDEFKASLQRFGPIVLVAGEELEAGKELVDRILWGESAPMPELCAELVTVYGWTHD